MASLWRLRRIVSLVLLCGAAGGCQALFRYRPVSVQVVDSETHAPIPGADVRISYTLTAPSQAPFDSCGTTGKDGTVQLRAAPSGRAGLMLQATAPGYLADESSMPVQAIEALEPSPLLGPDEKRGVNFVMELYAAPSPKVELVLPNGYRGLVKAEIQIQEDAKLAPGQRCFTYHVPASGIVQVVGPPILRRIYSPDFKARYEDGTVIARRVDDRDVVGFFPLQRERMTEVFVVGTKSEFDMFRRDLIAQNARVSRTGHAWSEDDSAAQRPPRKTAP